MVGLAGKAKKINNVKIPYIRKEIVLFAAGIWNGWIFTEEMLKKAFEHHTLNRDNSSLFLNHEERSVEKYVGQVENIKLEADGRWVGDLIIIDKQTAQILESGVDFGISPTIFINPDESNGFKIDNLSVQAYSVVTDPAIQKDWINKYNRSDCSKLSFNIVNNPEVLKMSKKTKEELNDDSEKKEDETVEETKEEVKDEKESKEEGSEESKEEDSGEEDSSEEGKEEVDDSSDDASESKDAGSEESEEDDLKDEDSKEDKKVGYAKLADAAFAVISKGKRYLPHHTESAKDGFDNKSVDPVALRAALASIPSADMPQKLKDEALEHLNKHAEVVLKKEEEVKEEKKEEKKEEGSEEKEEEKSENSNKDLAKEALEKYEDAVKTIEQLEKVANVYKDKIASLEKAVAEFKEVEEQRQQEEYGTKVDVILDKLELKSDERANLKADLLTSKMSDTALETIGRAADMKISKMDAKKPNPKTKHSEGLSGQETDGQMNYSKMSKDEKLDYLANRSALEHGRQI